eukprot:2397668-Prymnesium_polylepis.1
MSGVPYTGLDAAPACACACAEQASTQDESAPRALWQQAQQQLSVGMGFARARSLPAECLAADAFSEAAQRVAGQRE